MNRGVVSSVSSWWSLLVVLDGCAVAHAYIGARGAAQDVIGAISAAAHSLPGRPFGRQRGPGARRARLDIRSGGLAAIGEVVGQAAWVSSSRSMWNARLPIFRATVSVAGFAPAWPRARTYSS
jgi:hypothetical protein